MYTRSYEELNYLLLYTLHSDIVNWQNSILCMGEPIVQLGERRTLDRKVAGSILTRVAVLCP